MSFELTQQIKVLTAHANVDEFYGPYVGTDQITAWNAANTAVKSSIRVIGRTVLLVYGQLSYSDGTLVSAQFVEEWWYEKGIFNQNLVKKGDLDLSIVNTSDLINDGEGDSPFVSESGLSAALNGYLPKFQHQGMTQLPDGSWVQNNAEKPDVIYGVSSNNQQVMFNLDDIGGGAQGLLEEVTSDYKVGAIDPNESFPLGLTLTQVISKIFKGAFNPDINYPTGSMSITSGGGAKEVGETAAISVSTALVRGSVYGSTSGAWVPGFNQTTQYSGQVINNKFKLTVGDTGTTQVGNTFTFPPFIGTTASPIVRYADINYEGGTYQPLNSTGGNYGTICPAGTISNLSVSVPFYNRRYIYIVENLNPSTPYPSGGLVGFNDLVSIRNAGMNGGPNIFGNSGSLLTGNVTDAQIVIPGGFGGNSGITIVIAVPGNKSLTTFTNSGRTENYLTSSAFKMVEKTGFPCAGSTQMTYKVYTLTVAIPFAPNTILIYSIS